jgi:hypothetical protein
MAKSILGTKKRRGRPRTTGPGAQIGMRWQAAELAALDAWREKQDDKPSRAEAIRRLVKGALALPTGGRKAKEASDLAARAIDRVVDKSMPPEEQARRKRALIKGPREFRDIRGDQPKPKRS